MTVTTKENYRNQNFNPRKKNFLNLFSIRTWFIWPNRMDKTLCEHKTITQFIWPNNSTFAYVHMNGQRAL